MPSLLQLLQEEKTAKLLQGVFKIAGSFVMQQINGGNSDEEERALLDQYYKSAMDVAEKGKKTARDIPEQRDEKPDEPDIPLIEGKVSIRDTKTTSCIACGKNHTAAAAGLLAEGKRFLDEGLASPEVAKRIDLATQEITTMERGDLHPDSIEKLPPDEKELAKWMAKRIRESRHTLDNIKSKEDYQNAITELSDLSREITKRYYTLMESIAPEKEFEAIKKICNGKPEGEREKCLETMTQVLKQ